MVAETSAAAVRAGLVRLQEYPYALANGEPVTAAFDAQFATTLNGRPRLFGLLASVFAEVERRLTPAGGLPDRLHVLLSLPEGRPGFSDDDATEVARAVFTHFQGKGIDAFVEVAGRGHAGGIVAVQRALQEHERGADGPFIIVGVECYLDIHTIAWLDRQGLLAQPQVRNGFVPGEGAGCMVLASGDRRRQLRWPSLAVLGGVGTGHEAQLRDSDMGSFGVGMTHAVLSAAAGLAETEVDTIYIDLNGERYRSEEWGFVALRTHGLWRSLEYDAPSDCWGDVGAAWGPLAAVLAVRSFVRGYARGPRAMVLGGSLSGLRGAMILQDPRLG
ncbi:3-oxoacyl-(acyl-carrier-protein) synthase [Enhygromyxa salina]|uniref:3-oxoacyl-(Acyl-carrier-protein) synthase n=1 Tax=Enhygromyxa salina TaxID=215803 RepID=A0A0C1ZJV6_9BACT|nr:3-oxoacyl-(acyl-carrier-protein) synthase [Enhygromyxa salina]